MRTRFGKMFCSSLLATLLAAGFAALFAAPVTASTPGRVSHDAGIIIDVENSSVAFADRITISNAGEIARGSRLLLGLADGVEIGSLTVAGRAGNFSRDGDGIWVETGASETLEITIAGVMRIAGGNGAFLDADGGFIPALLPHPPGIAADWKLDIKTGPGITAVAAAAIEDGRFSARQRREMPEIMTGPYEMAEKTISLDGRNITIRTFLHPEVSHLGESYLDESARQLERFSSLLGGYPYSYFHVVSAPGPWGVAFEGATYMSRRILGMDFIRQSSLGHEILHSWWGGAVGIDYQTGNWAEGLTTYMTTHTLGREPGDDILASEKATRVEWLRNHSALAPGNETALVEFRMRHHDRSQVIGYAKGAFVFHMLRREMGDEAFIDGLRIFYKNNNGRIAGWNDVAGAFSRAAGRDLGQFFRQWLERPGAPALVAEINPAPGRVDISLRQQVREQGFYLRVPAVVETADAAQQHELLMEKTGQDFTIPVTNALRVRIDPDFDVFRRLLPGEAPLIIRDVTLAGTMKLMVLDNGADEMAPALERLAAVLGEGGVTMLAPGPGIPDLAPGSVMMLGGERGRVMDMVKSGKIGPWPGNGGPYRARAWVAVTGGGAVVLAVEAADRESLELLARFLPHYRGKSWLGIGTDGKRISGVLPITTAGPLAREFPQ